MTEEDTFRKLKKVPWAELVTHYDKLYINSPHGEFDIDQFDCTLYGWTKEEFYAELSIRGFGD